MDFKKVLYLSVKKLELERSILIYKMDEILN